MDVNLEWWKESVDSFSQEINDGSSGVTCPDIDELVSTKKKMVSV